MMNEEDYYTVLGVSQDASVEQIKESYVYKVNILHPDRLSAMPERIRRLAEEDLKKVNVAYGVLSNPEKRRQYDIKRFGVSSADVAREPGKTKPQKKPQPEVYPKTISFNNVLPWAEQKGFFFIRNTGGPYSKVLISNPPEWIKITKTTPLQDSSKLPMQVYLEAMATQWGRVYSSEIVVRLDESEARVKIRLSTQRKPH